MDIEKLKAEFEQSECFKRLKHVAQYTFFEFGAYIKRTDVPADAEKKCGKLITALLFSWSAWKEAKTQADQKIKLLLCDEHLKKCESPTGIFNSQYPDEEPCLICLAKKAKAQAVPEKTVQLHLVWNENKDECVGFLDSKDARYTATGDDRGMFGVTALGDYFRDLNDERNEFETQIVMIEAQESAND